LDTRIPDDFAREFEWLAAVSYRQRINYDGPGGADNYSRAVDCSPQQFGYNCCSFHQVIIDGLIFPCVPGNARSTTRMRSAPPTVAHVLVDVIAVGDERNAL
jgi:hypothetical protein